MLTTDLSQMENAIKALKKANFIWIIGNGGSAAQADHLACDLLKNAQKKAISLCSNNSLLLAIGNDYNFTHIFKKQLEVLFDLKNDVLICISTSGESENLVNAAHYVFSNGGTVIAITGTIVDIDGGYLQNYATHKIIIGNEDQQECEDIFGAICHKIYKGLK
jgi:D-sedoheptulose 7-phosphate isomerase